MFTQDSILFDADGRTIRGKDEIMLYSEVSFEYGRERDGQAFVLQSTNILADRSSASTIYDIGDYDWSNVESGR
uniref:Uncharacterized protein n=1 Tax=Plectus sambesii TaxID=2011161 RepID=A0A914W7Y1_9BILA